MARHDLGSLALEARHLSTLLSLLTTHVPQADVWAYGSRVNGGWHEGSDLDLVVRNPGDLECASSSLPALRDALSDSNLPMLVDVLDWAELPTDMRNNIERGYVVLLCQPG